MRGQAGSVTEISVFPTGISVSGLEILPYEHFIPVTGNIMDDLGSNLSSIIKAKVDSGQELRVVFDNFDFRILTNIILRNHRN